MSLQIAIRRLNLFLIPRSHRSTAVASLANRTFSSNQNDLEKPVLKDNILPVRSNPSFVLFRFRLIRQIIEPKSLTPDLDSLE